MLTKGTYTASCPECDGKSTTLVHVLRDGTISPSSCSECGTEFENIDKGEARNSFVFVGKIETVEENIVEEETKKISKKSSGSKTSKKSSGKKSSGKKSSGKKSSGSSSFTLKI